MESLPFSSRILSPGGDWKTGPSRRRFESGFRTGKRPGFQYDYQLENPTKKPVENLPAASNFFHWELPISSSQRVAIHHRLSGSSPKISVKI